MRLLSIIMALFLLSPVAHARPAGLFETIEHGGLVRSYYLFVPPEIARTEPAPLMFAFHGTGGTGHHMARMTGFDQFARKHKMIVVYPDGVEKKWNDNRPQIHKDGPVDDVGFARALIEKLAKRLPIDRKRIYASGFSNGGGMAQWLGCEAAGTFAAIASLGRTLHNFIGRDCDPSRAVPVLFVLGKDDPIVPYEGGPQPFSTASNMMTSSGPDSAQFWARKAGLPTKPKRTELDDKIDDGTMVTRFVHAEKGKAVQVALYAIDGAGHTWPRGYNALPFTLTGAESRELHASPLVMTWLLQFSLPE